VTDTQGDGEWQGKAITGAAVDAIASYYHFYRQPTAEQLEQQRTFATAAFSIEVIF
jgi:hypothetical protein